jgi:hypothetical protein
LISQKWSDYQLFKQVIDLMKRKEHLTNEGMRSLQKIVSLKSVFFNNKGEGRLGLCLALAIANQPTIK